MNSDLMTADIVFATIKETGKNTMIAGQELCMEILESGIERNCKVVYAEVPADDVDDFADWLLRERSQLN